MAEESKSKDTSFLDEKPSRKIHVKDVLFIVLRNLHWLIICAVAAAAVCAALFPKKTVDTAEDGEGV